MCTGLEQIKYGLFSFPLWVCTIVFLSLSIVMGLVTIGFSIFNIFGRPIETITGPMGLYLWNGLSCERPLVLSLSVSMYSVKSLLRMFYSTVTIDQFGGYMCFTVSRPVWGMCFTVAQYSNHRSVWGLHVFYSNQTSLGLHVFYSNHRRVVGYMFFTLSIDLFWVKCVLQ